MIQSVLPTRVVGREVFDDPPNAVMLPAEELFVAGAVDKRRREFATVRHCARAALVELGVGPVPLPRGERGAPSWPDGVVGSMTHCDGYRAAAVAWSADVASLGIDAEPHDVLPPEVIDLVLRPEERERVEGLARTIPTVHWDRLWFSAKESVYKAWSPVTGGWLGFDEASVDVDAATGRFTAWLSRPLPVGGGRHLDVLDGRWMCRRGLILTAVVIRDGYGSRR